MTNTATHNLNHLGIIMDGNRRWAKSKGVTYAEGHAAGYETFKKIARASIKMGIPYVSVFSFSTENWNRTKDEVKYLMTMALRVATRDINQLHKENIRVIFLGSRSKLSQKLLKAIDKAEALTKDNSKGTIALCFNYGGKDEIVHAVQRLLVNNVSADDVTEAAIEQNLYSNKLPPVDLVIRTSGEHRTSGFMLWRAAYAEWIFFDKRWPEFGTDDLRTAVEDYSKRQRRFGV